MSVNKQLLTITFLVFLLIGIGLWLDYYVYTGAQRPAFLAGYFLGQAFGLLSLWQVQIQCRIRDEGKNKMSNTLAVESTKICNLP